MNENQEDVFCISMGTCKLYRKRVQKAIFLLKNEYVYWLDEE